MQWLNWLILHLQVPASHLNADSFQLLRFPSSSLRVAWENSGGRPKALGPCTPVGDLEDFPGSWLRIGTAQAIVVTWGRLNKEGDLPLCFFSSL